MIYTFPTSSLDSVVEYSFTFFLKTLVWKIYCVLWIYLVNTLDYRTNLVERENMKENITFPIDVALLPLPCFALFCCFLISLLKIVQFGPSQYKNYMKLLKNVQRRGMWMVKGQDTCGTSEVLWFVQAGEEEVERGPHGGLQLPLNGSRGTDTDFSPVIATGLKRTAWVCVSEESGWGLEKGFSAEGGGHETGLYIKNVWFGISLILNTDNLTWFGFILCWTSCNIFHPIYNMVVIPNTMVQVQQ